MINVIIPAYNCTATLGRTLASLAAQTDPDFSVIIVDDCSTENLLPIVDDYSNKLRIKYIRKPENQGCGMARQTGIDNVTASHFTFLDADDILMPYAVEVFNQHIKANPRCEYVHSHFYEQTITHDGNPAYLLHTNGFVWCHGKLYSAEAVKCWGIRNNPAIRWADDSFFNSMCSELLKMETIPQPMAIWTNTKTSAMRKEDPFRDQAKVKDFLTAMLLSCEFVAQHKDHIAHVPVTVENIAPYVMPNTVEADMLNRLVAYMQPKSSE